MPLLSPSMQWSLQLNPKKPLHRIMTKAHRFRHLRKLSIFGTEAKYGLETDETTYYKIAIGMFALLKWHKLV